MVRFNYWPDWIKRSLSMQWSPLPGESWRWSWKWLACRSTCPENGRHHPIVWRPRWNKKGESGSPPMPAGLTLLEQVHTVSLLLSPANVRPQLLESFQADIVILQENLQASAMGWHRMLLLRLAAYWTESRSSKWIFQLSCLQMVTVNSPVSNL